MARDVEFRAASLEERKGFYEREFSIDNFKRWCGKNGMKLPQLCAIDAGTESGIIKNRKWKGLLFYFPFKELLEKIKKYNPEDVYYDRNTYKNFQEVLRKLKFKWSKQELTFDIDVDNFRRKCLNDKKICDDCIGKAYEKAKMLKKELKKLGFKKMGITYSGRGFHVHVFDEKAYLMNVRDREKLNRKLENYPIDEWVSRGNIGLMRMPFTLHGLVSRICLPVEKSFDKRKAIPKFLKT